MLRRGDIIDEGAHEKEVNVSIPFDNFLSLQEESQIQCTISLLRGERDASKGT